MMDSEKQLLEIISEKEEILRREAEKVIRQAEEQLSQSRSKAALILDVAEKEGKEAADVFFHEEMEKLSAEICSLKSAGVLEAEEMKNQGTSRIPRAVSRIVTLVTG